MALIIESSRSVFDTTQIEKGDLLYAKHRSWTEGRAGIVIAVSEDRIIVQFLPGIGNVVNHFFIPVEEAAENQWTIRWSKNLIAINKWGLESDEP